MLNRATCLAAILAATVLVATAPAAGAATNNTQSRLERLGEDLAGAWSEFGKDVQKPVREQRIADIMQQFNKDLTGMEPPPNYTIDRSINALIENVGKARQLLKLETMKSDRLTYINTCCDVFKRELPQTTDFKATRSNQQTWDLVMNAFVSAQSNLRIVPPEQRTVVYQNLNTGLLDVVKRAVPPARVNAAEEMDDNLKQARQKFPTSNPDLETANRPIYSILEGIARTLEQQSVRK